MNSRSDRGQATVLTLVFLVVLLGMAALVLDIGSWYRADRATQNTADAAALAGAQALPSNPGNANTKYIGSKNIFLSKPEAYQMGKRFSRPRNWKRYPTSAVPNVPVRRECATQRQPAVPIQNSRIFSKRVRLRAPFRVTNATSSNRTPPSPG